MPHLTPQEAPLPISLERGSNGYAICPRCQAAAGVYIAGHVSSCRSCGLTFSFDPDGTGV